MKRSNKLSKRDVVKVVREYIQDCHPSGLTLEIVEEDVRKEKYWWYVPVRADREPPKLFEYYESLADVEERLDENESLEVFLVPAGPA